MLTPDAAGPSTDPATGPRRCAVLGSPIAHSLSPVLHRAAYAELGLDWRYEAHEVAEDGLAGFLAGLDASWRGLSLTMPLKRAVLPLLDEVRAPADAAGAVNTVLLEDGLRVGHNTDVPGMVAAVRERYEGACARAVVLGGGATAASALLALSDLGCTAVDLVVRDPRRAGTTAAVAEALPGGPAVRLLALEGWRAEATDVLLSTIPAEAQRGAVLDAVAHAGVVFDVRYEPWPSPLASAATTAGRPVVGGLDLLVHQAVLQVRLMTGREAPLAAMRAAGERALAERA